MYIHTYIPQRVFSFFQGGFIIKGGESICIYTHIRPWPSPPCSCTYNMYIHIYIYIYIVHYSNTFVYSNIVNYSNYIEHIVHMYVYVYTHISGLDRLRPVRPRPKTSADIYIYIYIYMYVLFHIYVRYTQSIVYYV